MGRLLRMQPAPLLLAPLGRQQSHQQAKRTRCPCPRSAGAKDSGSVVGTDAQTL
jgi:hypothetical protein